MKQKKNRGKNKMNEITLSWVTEYKRILKQSKNTEEIITKYNKYCEQELKKINNRWNKHKEECKK